MKKIKQIEEIHRLLNLVSSKKTDTVECAAVNDSHVYTSDVVKEIENSLLFDKYPHLIGFSGDLKERGSFFRVSIRGLEVLAVRDSNMIFRAYINHCRHRGVILEQRETGVANGFSCFFHKWTYSTDGELVQSPWRARNKSSVLDVGLLELPCVEAAGLLWLYTDKNADISKFNEHVDKELIEEMQHFDFDKHTRIGSDIVSSESNWKLGYDTFGESHHFKYVHKTTLGAVTHCDSSSFQKLGRSSRVFVPRIEIDNVSEKPEHEWNIAAVSFPVYRIFPNSIIVVGEDTSYLIRLEPVENRVDAHAAYATFYSKDGSVSDADVERIYKMMDENPDLKYVEQKTIAQLFTTILRDEDYAPLEDQQKSAKYFSGVGFIFEQNEPALHHFYSVYAKELGLNEPKILEK